MSMDIWHITISFGTDTVAAPHPYRGMKAYYIHRGILRVCSDCPDGTEQSREDRQIERYVR